MWRTEYRCVSCKGVLSYIAKMDSHGRCPRCGYKHHTAHTIVATTEHAYRLVRTAPRWKFWIPLKREYK